MNTTKYIVVMKSKLGNRYLQGSSSFGNRIEYAQQYSSKELAEQHLAYALKWAPKDVEYKIEKLGDL